MAASPSLPGAAIAPGFPFLCLMARTCWYCGSRAGSSPLAYPTNASVAQRRWSAVLSEFPRAAGHSRNPLTACPPGSDIDIDSGSLP